MSICNCYIYLFCKSAKSIKLRNQNLHHREASGVVSDNGTTTPTSQNYITVWDYITKNSIYGWRPNHRHIIDSNIVHGDIKQKTSKQSKTEKPEIASRGDDWAILSVFVCILLRGYLLQDGTTIMEVVVKGRNMQFYLRSLHHSNLSMGMTIMFLMSKYWLILSPPLSMTRCSVTRCDSHSSIKTRTSMDTWDS